MAENADKDKLEHAPSVPPFVQFVCSSLPMVFDDSLTYYEALSALWGWINKNIVPVINNNAGVTQEYIDLTKEFMVKFDELKDYVDNYFTNLDVQEEINNKLDAMVQDGTLQEIIDSFLEANVSWTFDTVADMQASTNLIEGSYAKTLGYTTLGDGGGAFYKITDTESADSVAVNDSLYANLLKGSSYDNNIFDLYGITYTSERHANGTKYYIVDIPYLNKFGTRNELAQGFGEDTYSTAETVASFANRKNSPFAMNVGLWDTVNHVPYAPVVQDGVEQTPSYSNAFQPIAIDADGMIKVYANGTTASDIITDGGVYACCAYHELIHENVVVYDTSEAAWNVTPYPRQVIAQLDNNDYVVFTCDGKDFEDSDVGLTYEEVCTILMARYDNIKTAYACDSGGSTSTVVNHNFINQPSDDNFTTERAVPTIWYIKPVNRINTFQSLYTRIGQLERDVKRNKANAEYSNTVFGTHGVVVKYNDVSERINAIDGRFRVSNVTANKDVIYVDLPSGRPNEFLLGGERVFSLFKIMKTPSALSITSANAVNYPSMIYADVSTLTDIPDPTIAHVLMTFPMTGTNHLMQIAIPINPNTTYKAQYRYSVEGSWRAWRLLQ